MWKIQTSMMKKTHLPFGNFGWCSGIFPSSLCSVYKYGFVESMLHLKHFPMSLKSFICLFIRCNNNLLYGMPDRLFAMFYYCKYQCCEHFCGLINHISDYFFRIVFKNGNTRSRACIFLRFLITGSQFWSQGFEIP